MPAGFNLPTSAVESIVGIQFGIFSPEEIIKRSVVEVISQNTYDGNEPKIGGLFDPRMGVLDNGKKCRSCGQTNHNCPGHFGHYRLARPVYFIQFLPIVLNVLRCVCIRCSKLLIDKDSHPRIAKRRGEARWREVYLLCGNISRCGQQTEDGCGARQPNRFVRDGIARIVAEWDAVDSGEIKTEKVRQPLDVEYVHRLFRQITDEDVDFMGFSRHWCRPDWMICTVLPIPPPQVRPSVIQDNNQRSEDDLTHKLFEIIRMNKVLQDKIDKNAARNQIEEYTDVLQYHIATLVDNKIPGVAPSAQRGGRPLKSIQQRIGGKEGRVRYNIQGKRVEQSARTVITPDPNISIAEVGVPMKIAMNLTRPERVTQWNRKKLYKFVQNGADVFPGAKSVVRNDGRMISLKHVNTKEIVLYNGDIVNRHLMDGDILLFNRQPTLHRLSMMGHIVKVLPFNTFRLNVSVTSPYNADFDGDEMNAHIPQSYEAFIELKEIAAVPHQIIRPRDATPVIGVVQDSLVGSYLATKPGNSFTRREFMNLMMWNKRFEGLPIPVDGSGKSAKFSGHQIIGSLLAPINMEMTNNSYKDDKSVSNIVKIREGVVMQGTFDKGIFNKPGRGIIHTTYNDYGTEDTVNLIDNIQCVIENYLIMKGFSVGISDLIADERTREEMNDVIQKCKKDIDEIILQLHNDLFVNNTGKTNQEEFETRCFINLNKALNESGKVGEGSLSTENRLVAMVKAGSKGGALNIAQMLACVGQQAPEGKRIPYGFTDRTLPHYKMYDDGAEARGFVESSFIRGLTPQEFFFHAMSGREGLIDTAVKTSETGYTQRQLIKAMEDLMINHDGTVRDSNGSIVQFYYGEDGINSTKVEACVLPLDKMTDTQIKTEFGLEGVPVEFVDQIIADRKMLIEGVFGSSSSIELFGPLNLERVILNIKIKFNLKEDTATTLTPDRIIADIQKILDKTQPYNKMWGAMLRFHFAPHKIINKEHFTEEAWSTLVDLVVLKDWKAWAQPGEFVGIIAAQSIGEPATQMTLNSVDWDTEIMIAKDGKILSPKIGEFIDNYLASCDQSKIKKLPNNQLYVELEGADWKAISTDQNGKMMWTKIEAITRHPVVNDDGTNTILEVELESGRTVKATKGKSFLTLVNGKIEDINGSELRVGDVIPIANNLDLSSIGYLKTLDLVEFLPKTEWLYGDDFEKAKDACAGPDRHWFQKNQGSLFTIPYSRSDAFLDAINGRNTNAESIKAGFIYPKRTRPDISQIPAQIELTEEFGFFVGAYLAEGLSNDTQINITNNDSTFLEKAGRILVKWNIGMHLVKEEKHAQKSGIKGTTTSLVVHSTLLAKIMQTVFGRVSYEKKMPSWLIQAPDEFLKGLVDAYICGDGTVEKRSGVVCATSVSKPLLIVLGAILARFNIFSTMSSYMPEKKNFDSVSRNYTLRIPEKYSKVFAEIFHLSILTKQQILDYHFLLNNEEHRCKREVFNNVVLDKIKSIKEVEPIKGWVYDLTVENTRNFTSLSLVNFKDTFHLAGVSSKSNMTRGVPRLKEMLKVTKNPKATALTVYLKPSFRENKDRVREVAQDLELTVMKDIVNRVAVYYDPTDEASVLEEDRELLKFYEMFESRETATDSEETAPKWSKWLLRLEFDRETMFNRNITIDDVNFVLADKFTNQINMVYSDFNSQRLVMRIRLATGDNTYGDDLIGIKKLQNRILNNIVIRGLPGIRSASFRKDKDKKELIDGEYKAIEQYVLDTDGSNFIEVMNHPAVDGNKIYSTNVHDIYQQLGIEAARSALFQEINVLFAEAGINYRHMGLLCDWMTRIGRFMTVDRYGINKNDTGPLSKASFEETERVMLKAALYGEIDPVTGISANIMTGQTLRGGTAFTQILLDEFALPRLMEGLPAMEEAEEENEGPQQENIDNELYEDTNDACAATNLRMNLEMPATIQENNEEDIEITVLDEV
jgi:DNA-directed RNA polymerase beta' subunit